MIIILLSKKTKSSKDGPSTCYVTDAPVIIPAYTDFMIIYSTLPGCASFRDPNKGSLFIRVLCYFLRPEFAQKYDLIRILQFVTNGIQNWDIPRGNPIQSQCFERYYETMNYVIQVPEYTSALTKDVYFDVIDNSKNFQIIKELFILSEIRFSTNFI